MNRSYSIEDIEDLFLRFGDKLYDPHAPEPVTVLAHALQCAQLAEWANADEALVGAAFLHDLGHLLAEPGAQNDHTEGTHEALVVPYLEEGFSEHVIGPIRLHGAARRYLAGTDAAYLKDLSTPMRHAMERQGGAMTAAEARQFESMPYAMDAVQLHRWDDLARVPAQRTPPLDYYLALLEDLQRQVADRDKLEVGPQTVT